jgi:hypothetical protein
MVLLLVFGVFYALEFGKKFANFQKPPTEKMFWMYKHIGQMGGAYIATMTAFLVNNYVYSLYSWCCAVVITDSGWCSAYY